MIDTTRASVAVSEQRLWQRHMDMARFGATTKGGVNRQALSAEDAQSRAQLTQWAKARGFSVYVDAIGNMFVRREGTDKTANPVMTGSHLDSQPTGGKFDGTYGVLAGFEALEALEDAGIATRRPIEVVAWTNEEGNRFQPGAMGSAVFAGSYDLAKMLAVRDQAGVSVGDALKETLKAAPAAKRADKVVPDSYIEAHIEQGPRLEAEGKTIGVVTLIQGQRRLLVDITGEEAHAGTTPERVRKDAFKAAMAMVAALEPVMHDPSDTVRFTIGRFEVYPGSPSTVPSRVHFIIDLRHPEPPVIKRLGDAIAGICAANARGCEVKVTSVAYVQPTIFPAQIVDLVRSKAAALGLPHMDIPSGAGHDAMHVAKLCPAGMIFVPCLRGISHNETESATSSDLAAGAKVLADALVALANR